MWWIPVEQFTWTVQYVMSTPTMFPVPTFLSFDFMDIVLSVSTDSRIPWRLILTQLSCSSLHFGVLGLGPSVLVVGVPHLSGPEQHSGIQLRCTTETRIDPRTERVQWTWRGNHRACRKQRSWLCKIQFSFYDEHSVSNCRSVVKDFTPQEIISHDVLFLNSKKDSSGGSCSNSNLGS